MGCSSSKLDDEEAVQLCRDRKKFIKQAVEQRARFASGHLAYIQSLKRVSAALREYVEGDEPRDFSLDSFVKTPALTPPMKKESHGGFITISPDLVPPARIRSKPNSNIRVNYLRSGTNPAVSIEERPQSPEFVRVENYANPMQYQYSPPPMQYSFFDYSHSPHRPSTTTSIPPPSPQTSQWDFFWNPFSSLENYGYQTHHTESGEEDEEGVTDSEEDTNGLRRVREEEGIPDLEDDIELDEDDINDANNLIHERRKLDCDCDCDCDREGVVEDIDEDEDSEEEEEVHEEIGAKSVAVTDHVAMGLQQSKRKNIEISRYQTAKQIQTGHRQELPVGDLEQTEQTSGVRFTAYANRRPTSMAEVVKDLEDQFIVVCKAANEVSTILEARKAYHHSMVSSELTVKKILNPVSLIRSASSRSSSSRFAALNLSSPATEESGEESSSDVAEECIVSNTHRSTLDRLYAWEKKLYDEVRSGEKVRIAYEKKCNQLRNHDVRGDDPSCVEKTRAVVRDLHTQIKVSIHSVEAISKRIETLRDEELQPQLLELVEGLSRMWKVMGECHKSQKRTVDEAKLLLAGTPSKNKKKKHEHYVMSDPQRVARCAANLETELKNWRGCFESWIASQRSFARALSSWLLRCSPDPTTPHSLSSSTMPIFGLCVEWSKSLDAAGDAPVLDGLDFFASGMGSIYAAQPRFEEGGMEVAVDDDNDNDGVLTAEKLAEVAVRVLCAGMSVAVTSLTEFSAGSAKGYADLISQWGSARWPREKGEKGANEALGV